MPSSLGMGASSCLSNAWAGSPQPPGLRQARPSSPSGYDCQTPVVEGNMAAAARVARPNPSRQITGRDAREPETLRRFPRSSRVIRGQSARRAGRAGLLQPGWVDELML